MDHLKEFVQRGQAAQRTVDAITPGNDRLRQYGAMARAVHGKPFDEWPAWSTGETLIVALVLNRADVLDATSWTIVEALDRVDLTAEQLRHVERQVQESL